MSDMSASDSMYNVCIFMSSTERMGIDLDGRRYFLASEAAADFGFSPDHIARLARQGKINGRRVGKKWYVEPESLQTYLKVLEGPPRPASLSSEVPEHTSAERIAHHMHTRGRHTMRDWSPPNEASERRQTVSPLFPLASLALAIILSTAAAYAAFNPTGASTIASRVQSQFAAVSADTSIFDRAAHFLFRAVCPIFRSCDPNDVRIADADGADQNIPSTPLPRQAATTVPTPSTSSPQAASTLSASASSASNAAANPPVVQRVVERIVERPLPTYTITQGGISEAVLNDRLNQLDNKLSSWIFSLSASLTSAPNSLPASGGITNNIALSQRIDQLNGTTITNPTITGGSITGSSIIGTISNAIATALATIDDLTSTTITATNATFTNSTTTNATTTNLYAASLVADNATTTSSAVLGAATSSFGGGVSAVALSASATSTFSGLVLELGQLRLSPLDCTSYANGGALTTDGNGNVVCSADDGGAGSTVAGADTQIQFNNGGSFGAAANFTFSSSTGKLTLPNASTTNLTASYASSTQGFFGSLSLGSLSGVLKATGGLVSAASPGSDYESPLTFGYPLTRSLNAISLAFGTTTTNSWAHQIFSSLFALSASTTNATTTNLHITSLTNSGLGVDANGKVYAAATSTLATISGTLALTQLANQAANTVLANGTGGSAAPTAIATSSFFGTGIGGTVLSWNNNVPQWVATTTFSTGLTYANGAVVCDTASGSALGCLSSADWTTFNDKQAAGNYITALTGDVTASGPGSASVSFALGNTHWWTAQQNFGNASTSQFTATSSVWFTSLGTPAGTFLAVDPNGLLIATSTPAVGGSGTVTNIATTYPITGGPITTTGTLSLAFGTTTTNSWTHQIFSSLFASSASTTNATTTNLHITGLSSSGLGVDANGKVYAAPTSTLATISGTLALTQLAT